jgi:ketosteroid isomerase-like protein
VDIGFSARPFEAGFCEMGEMNVIDEAFAMHFAQAWVSAWNAHDLDQVLAHYDDDFEFQSPMITVVTGQPSGRLKGKAAVGAYWEAAVERLPDLTFQLRDVLLGVDCLTLYYQGHRGAVAETFFFGGGAKVVRATATYGCPT